MPTSPQEVALADDVIAEIKGTLQRGGLQQALNQHAPIQQAAVQQLPR